MEQQSTGRLIGMVLAGLLGVIPMLLYDYVVVKLLEKEGKPPMKRMDWLTSAWVTNTINNLAGFGGVVGATLRINFTERCTAGQGCSNGLKSCSVLDFRVIYFIFCGVC